MVGLGIGSERPPFEAHGPALLDRDGSEGHARGRLRMSSRAQARALGRVDAARRSPLAYRSGAGGSDPALGGGHSVSGRIGVR